MFLALAVSSLWTTMASGAEHVAVEPKISVPKTCYQPGEPINVLFRLRNPSDQAVTVSTRWSHPRSQAIRLIGPDGQPVKPSIIAVLGLPSRETFVTLPPNGVYESALLLGEDEWPHSVPGNYRLQVVYQNRGCDFFDPTTGQRRGTLTCWVGSR